jgi:hypothetical protein
MPSRQYGMKVAAVKANFPERVAVIGPLDGETNMGSIRRNMGSIVREESERLALNREQLVRIGSVSVRLIYVGVPEKYQVAAVG